MSIKAAVIGLGNIGRYAVEALEAAPDFTCVGVVRRKESLGTAPHDLRGVAEYASLADLEAVFREAGRPAPVRAVPQDSRSGGRSARQGCDDPVDSFDIHDRIVETIGVLEAQAAKGGAVAVTAAGWDPGTDSAMRALFEAMVPVGTTFTNFGRGRSMGHSVAARALPGVADATSITIPLGGGRHSRLVYVVLEGGAAFEDVHAAIKADPYFAHDPLEVRQVTQEELPRVADASHGVLMERLGASGLDRQPASDLRHAHRQPRVRPRRCSCSSARAAVRLAQAWKARRVYAHRRASGPVCCPASAWPTSDVWCSVSCFLSTSDGKSPCPRVSLCVGSSAKHSRKTKTRLTRRKAEV